MPKIVMEILITLVSAAMFTAGLWMIIWPNAALKRMKDLSENATPTQAVWNTRLTGVALVFFGWAGLHLVLIQGLKPFPPGENGVGF